MILSTYEIYKGLQDCIDDPAGVLDCGDGVMHISCRLPDHPLPSAEE